MLGKLFDRLLVEDENKIDKVEKDQELPATTTKSTKLLAFLIFGIAFGLRVFTLFYLTIPENAGPGWYGDAYHHWQIAYLSKEIGFKESFLRLWDFKGLEYYWGLLHPLVLAIGFAVTGSTSIVVSRMVSVIFGSFSVALVFLILNKYFDKKTAIVGSIFMAFLPVSVFSDTAGMQEPLGLTFILLGIYFIDSTPLLAGVSLMLSGMVRSEYWIFSGIILTLIILRQKMEGHHKVIILLGYLILMILYMKYLLDYTGNPIYPVWTAYLATYKGEWFLNVGISSFKEMVKQISRYIVFGSLASIAVVAWKRPRYMPFFLLGFLNITLIAAMHGFGAYIKGFEMKVLVDRLLAFPYSFLGIFLAIILVYFIPRLLPQKIRIVGAVFGILGMLVLILLSQLSWKPTLYYYKAATGNFSNEIALAHSIASYYKREGSILIPADRMVVTYALVNYEKIPGRKLISQLYDPFYYYKGTDPFEDWEEYRKEIIKWLEKNDAELYVTGVKLLANLDTTYQEKMLEREQGKLFTLLGEKNGFFIYSVNLDAKE